MKYEDIITIVSAIVNNEEIVTKGLTLLYELDKKLHKQMDEELYIRVNGNLNGFEHQEIVEIEMNGILVRFIKKDE